MCRMGVKTGGFPFTLRHGLRRTKDSRANNDSDQLGDHDGLIARIRVVHEGLQGTGKKERTRMSGFAFSSFQPVSVPRDTNSSSVRSFPPAIVSICVHSRFFRYLLT